MAKHVPFLSRAIKYRSSLVRMSTIYPSKSPKNNFPKAIQEMARLREKKKKTRENLSRKRGSGFFFMMKNGSDDVLMTTRHSLSRPSVTLQRNTRGFSPVGCCARQLSAALNQNKTVAAENHYKSV